MPQIRQLKRSGLAALVVALSTITGAAPLHAQSTPPVREDATVRGLLSNLVIPFVNANENPADIQARAERFVVGIANGIALGISTVPLGTSSAGFAFVRDAATGERLLKSDSFGPVFLDRPLTGGKGQFSAGFHYQRLEFNKFQGFDVINDGVPTYDNEVLFRRDGLLQYQRERLLFDTTVSVAVLTASYGATEALDIGVAVPIVSIDMNAQRIHDYDYTHDWADFPDLRARLATPTGREVRDVRHASATGLGDIALRVKYAFGRRGKTQPVAAALDLRMPTGKEEDLLGSGKVSAKLQLLAIQPIGSLVNVYGAGGYTFNTLSDQVNYGAAIDFALLPRKQLTVSADIVGETLRESVTTFETVPAYTPTENTIPGLEFRGVRRTSFDRYFFNTGSVSLLRAGVGAKYHVGGNVLITGSVQFPLNDNGFRAGVTPFVGIEKTWAR